MLFCFVILIKTVQAQPGKFSLSVAPGVAIPLGKFAAKDVNDKSAAFANTGAVLNVALNYKLGNTFSLGVLLSGQQNGVDTKAEATQAAAKTPNSEVSVKSIPWMMGKVLLGGNLLVPFTGTGKLLFTARLMAGVLKTSQPSISFMQITGNPGNPGSTISTYSRQNSMPLPWAFVYLAGAGLQYNISKTVYLHGGVDYTSAAPKAIYPNTVVTGTGVYSGGPVVIPTGNNPYERHQGLSSLNITFGIGTKL